MPEQTEAVLIEGEPVPVSALTVAVTGSPSLVTLRETTEGPEMKIRITRACNSWVEGDTPTVNEEYAKQLVANGLAEPIKAGKPAPAGGSAVS